MALETLFLQSFLAINDYYRLNYQRTASGIEVDFIAYGQHALIAFEIKHAALITPKMLHGLKHFKQDYPMAKLYIIYLGEVVLHLADEITALPMKQALLELPEILRATP